MRIYLDHNATTPLAPAVLDTMVAALRDTFGNPSSVHSFGQQARVRVDEARAEIAALVGGDPSDIVFTGGGTEGGATRKPQETTMTLIPSYRVTCSKCGKRVKLYVQPSAGAFTCRVCTKYAMSLRTCHQLGTAYAVAGIPLARLIDELARDGYPRTGLTVRRVTRAYNEQVARG